MKPEQSRMARAALQWSLSHLAEKAGIGRATVARFELGEAVSESSIAALARAFEAAGVRFIDRGVYAGGVCPPNGG